jgi:hypothetical protein
MTYPKHCKAADRVGGAARHSRSSRAATAPRVCTHNSAMSACSRTRSRHSLQVAVMARNAPEWKLGPRSTARAPGPVARDVAERRKSSLEATNGFIVR